MSGRSSHDKLTETVEKLVGGVDYLLSMGLPYDKLGDRFDGDAKAIKDRCRTYQLDPDPYLESYVAAVSKVAVARGV